MAQGRDNPGIAAQMHLAESSVGKHVNAILSTLGLSVEHPPAGDRRRPL